MNFIQAAMNAWMMIRETLNYLNESCAEGIDADKDLIRKNELLALSPEGIVSTSRFKK